MSVQEMVQDTPLQPGRCCGACSAFVEYDPKQQTEFGYDGRCGMLPRIAVGWKTFQDIDADEIRVPVNRGQGCNLFDRATESTPDS